MDHLAAKKLELTARITDEAALIRIETLLTTYKAYAPNERKENSANDPVVEYMKEQDEREMLLQYIEHPAIARKLSTIKEKASRGEVVDNDIVHKETMEWLN
jgi:hypothetical protein